jgi:hypothetical protein
VHKLNGKEVILMATSDKKIKKQLEDKQPQGKTQSSCDCGCIPPPVKSK